jgi:hypothetical protein
MLGLPGATFDVTVGPGSLPNGRTDCRLRKPLVGLVPVARIAPRDAADDGFGLPRHGGSLGVSRADAIGESCDQPGPLRLVDTLWVAPRPAHFASTWDA